MYCIFPTKETSYRVIVYTPACQWKEGQDGNQWQPARAWSLLHCGYWCWWLWPAGPAASVGEEGEGVCVKI